MEPYSYKMKTTFWSDFSIADAFGTNAIQDTFDRAFEEWKTDYVYLTELVIVTNWKLWEHYRKGNDKYARLYDKLWRICDNYAIENLKDEELSYFLECTD